jgi:hypothetical protein
MRCVFSVPSVTVICAVITCQHFVSFTENKRRHKALQYVKNSSSLHRCVRTASAAHIKYPPPPPYVTENSLQVGKTAIYLPTAQRLRRRETKPPLTHRSRVHIVQLRTGTNLSSRYEAEILT